MFILENWTIKFILMSKLNDLKSSYFYTRRLTILNEIVVPTCTFKLLLNFLLMMACIEKIRLSIVYVYVPNSILSYSIEEIELAKKVCLEYIDILRVANMTRK